MNTWKCYHEYHKNLLEQIQIGDIIFNDQDNEVVLSKETHIETLYDSINKYHFKLGYIYTNEQKYEVLASFLCNSYVIIPNRN